MLIKKRNTKDQREAWRGMAKVSLYGRAMYRNMIYNTEMGQKTSKGIEAHRIKGQTSLALLLTGRYHDG